MIDNIFEVEAPLQAQLETLVDPSMVFPDEIASHLKLDIFKNIPDTDRVAVAIQYDGFNIISSTANTRNQLIEVRYRVIIVSPVDQKLLAGATFAAMLKLLSGMVMLDGYQPLTLIKDVREFNAAQYGDSMVGVPALFSFKTALRR